MSGLIDADGACIRFKLPVLTLGSGAGADFKIIGAADLHCLFVPTPAGPAIRSFAAETTLVNGVPTAATLLKNGDTVTICGQKFTVAWATAETLETQSKRLNELLEDRQAHVETLLVQLTEQREQFRSEKAGAKAKLAEIERKFKEAQELRAKTRTTAAKYLQARRAEIRAEREPMRETQLIIAAQRKQIEESETRLAKEHEQLRKEAEESNQRIAAAWAAMTTAQQQLAQERTNTERELANLFQMHDARKSEAADREKGIEAAVTSATVRLASLQSEIAGLEQRATHARMVVADLEQQRAQKVATVSVKTEAANDDWSVPLDIRPDGRSADQLLLQLRQQEQEVGKERQRLAVQLQHTAAEREQLHDQKALIAEQVRQLEAARRHWQAAETQAVGELEQLARTMAQKEQELDIRTRTLTVSEADRRAHAEQLNQNRKSLDEWQKSLTAQEHRFVSERQKADADLAERSKKIAEREKQSGDFFAKWDARYSEACAGLREEQLRMLEAKSLLADAIRRCTKERDTAQADLKRLTAKSMALEETKAALVKEHGPKARRILRLARRRWDGRLSAMLDATRNEKVALDAAVIDACDRLETLQKSFIQTADQQASTLTFERAGTTKIEKSVVLSMKMFRPEVEDIITLQRVPATPESRPAAA